MEMKLNSVPEDPIIIAVIYAVSVGVLVQPVSPGETAA